MQIEKNTDMKIKCHTCGNEYPMDMMRMHPDGRHLACRSCLERKPVHKESKAASEPKAQKSLKKEESPMKEYFCKACKYNFKRARHLVVSTCPYCGSANLNSKGSTARIIADAFRMKGD